MYTRRMNLMRNPMAHYLALTGIFFVLVLAMPAQQNILEAYNITGNQYHIYLFLYVVPFIGIWYAAFLAYKRLKLYSESINGSVEAKGYQILARGCGWLAYSLPISAIAGLIMTTIGSSNQNFKPAAVILTNYINLLLPLIGFIILGYSARRLSKLTKTKIDTKVGVKIATAFIILGLSYGYFSFQGIDMDSLASTQNAYFLPIWIIILSLTIPYLYCWFIGLFAAFEILIYARNSNGLLYRQALSYVGYGIATVIASSIIAQFLGSLPISSGEMSVNYAFATAYFIELVIAVGYVLIAIGSNKLKRIEEV